MDSNVVNPLAVFGLIVLMLTGCTGMPEKVHPVTGFELDRYLGQWHEIARLDHSFERDLTDVSAEYSLREDGGVKVVNRGFDQKKQQWKEAIGKAYFVETPDIGRLKVSFFGPFYGGYNIAMLDADYSSVLVIGPSLDYGWILARDKTLNSARCQALLNEAERIGIKNDNWIWLQDCRRAD